MINDHYMEPRHDEASSRQTASNLAYALHKMGIEIPDDVIVASKHFYGNASKLNSYTKALADLCQNMSEDQKNTIIYNGKEPKSRALASWWDTYLLADKKRIDKKMSDELKAEIIRKVDLYRLQLIDELSISQRELLKG